MPTRQTRHLLAAALALAGAARAALLNDQPNLLINRRMLLHAAATTTSTLGGVLPANAGPDFIISVTEHDAPVERVKRAYEQADERPERVIYCETRRGTALAVAFFAAAISLPTIQQLQRATTVHAHYLQPTNFRVPSVASAGRFMDVTPGRAAHAWSSALEKGAGIMVGAHGLTVGHSMWVSKFTSELSDGEHASYHVRRSIAGTLLAGSSDAPLPGPLVVHFTNSEEDAEALCRQLDPAVDARVQQALALGIMRPPVYAVSGAVVLDSML